jgi:hypothetical protein
MYARRIIESKRQAFARRHHWEPVYHSLAQVDEFKNYVKSITKIESNSKHMYIDLSKRLTQSRLDEIQNWVQNEQILCSIDESYWVTRYAYICDEKGEIFRFRPRQSQEAFDRVVAGFEDKEVAIELFLLKARQVGISTRVALKFLHRLLFLGNVQAVMASVQADKSELIGRILNICFERCPWWLVPQRIAERVGKMMEWNNGSVLSIQSGMQPTGIAQGWTPTAIHISEVGDIPNPKKVIEEGLLRATHPTRKLFQVFEGTGNGNTGWQADYWRAIKEDFPRGRARLCPLFLPWPLATDLYPEPDWLKKFPIPEDWYPSEDTRKHVRKCEFYIRSTPVLASLCGHDYVLPREQQWFWEFNYLAAVKTRTQRIWLSQMPADDVEALTGRNDLVFDPERIEVMTQERPRAYKVYVIIGPQIDDGFEPDPEAIDWDAPRELVEWTSHRGNHYSWTLVPLKPFDDSQEREGFDKVLVFEEPKPDRDYTLGIDTADGLGHDDEDRAVCNVTRLGVNATYPDVQVAEFASVRVNPPQMVGFAACLGAWYGAKARDPRGVKYVIEQRMKPGDDCQLQLKLMGFTWQHRMIRYDSKKIKETDAHKEGWFSNPWSVPFMTHRFVDAINNGWYQPKSPFFIRELGDYERKLSLTGKTKLEHQAGKHDDRIRAAAMAYISRHHLQVLQERSHKHYTVKSGVLPEIDRSYPELASVSVGE